MASMPSMNTRSRRLQEIPGLVPSPQAARQGCAFAPRCAHADARCRSQSPGLTQQGGEHLVACFAVEEGRLPMEELAL
jgi:peptide/nickel transport system ATP-binding protein